MKQQIYPAIFHEEDGRYWVEFPDLPGCLTEGDTLEEAFLMAGDALYCFLSDDGNQPAPSAIQDISSEGVFVQMVKAEPYLSDDAQKYFIEDAFEKGFKERHLNQSEVAKILDVDRSYVTHVMKGKRKPSQEMAKRFGLLLNFDWHILF